MSPEEGDGIKGSRTEQLISGLPSDGDSQISEKELVLGLHRGEETNGCLKEE